MSSTRSPELRLVADRQVEPLLADQNLADGFSAYGGFDGILNVAYVDPEAVGRRAIDIEIDVGLAANLKRSEVGDARDLAHDALNLVRFLLERLADRGRRALQRVRPLRR